jgi:hypothetical protein
MFPRHYSKVPIKSDNHLLIYNTHRGSDKIYIGTSLRITVTIIGTNIFYINS